MALIRKALNEVSQERMKAEEKNEQYEKALKTLQVETQSYIQTLEKIHTDSLQNMKEQVAILQKNYEQGQSTWKSIMEDQRNTFMIECDKLKMAKAKIEQIVGKQAIEIKYYTQQYQALQEQLRALQFDLSLAQQRQQEADRALIAQEIETTLKEKTLSEWQQKFEAAKEEIDILKQMILTFQVK